VPGLAARAQRLGTRAHTSGEYRGRKKKNESKKEAGGAFEKTKEGLKRKSNGGAQKWENNPQKPPELIGGRRFKKRNGKKTSTNGMPKWHSKRSEEKRPRWIKALGQRPIRKNQTRSLTVTAVRWGKAPENMVPAASPNPEKKPQPFTKRGRHRGPPAFEIREHWEGECFLS